MILTETILGGRTFVRSSNLHSVGYSLMTRTLEIQFRNGRIYQYFDVPWEIYDRLMNSGSHGRFFAYFIRNAYPFRRIQ